MSESEALIVEVTRGFGKSIRIRLDTLLTMARQQHIKSIETYKAILRDALEIAERYGQDDPDDEIPF